MSSIARDGIADFHCHRPAKARTIMHERVKLPMLAARVDPRRQILQQAAVIRSPGKSEPDFSFHARKYRLESHPDELSRRLPCVTLPDGKEAGHPCLGQVGFAPRPQVLEKEIAEADSEDALGPEIFHDPSP